MRSFVSLGAFLLAPLLLVAGCPGRKAAPESGAADAHSLAAPRASAAASAAAGGADGQPADIQAVRREADGWRREHRLIDMHEHVSPDPAALARAVKIYDAVGIGLAVNLSGGPVTPTPDGPSAFEITRAIADQLYPGRFLQYMNLDYSNWDAPDFARQAALQIERGAKLGAAGLKESKRLGLYLKDKAGKLIRIDDPKLDGVWRRCGELGLPVSIHTADPRAFWLPYDSSNERWEELHDHPRWWFGNPKKFPPREEAWPSDRILGRHPETTFVSVHFGSNAEDLAWVDKDSICTPTCGSTWPRACRRSAGTTPTRCGAYFSSTRTASCSPPTSPSTRTSCSAPGGAGRRRPTRTPSTSSPSTGAGSRRAIFTSRT